HRLDGGGGMLDEIGDPEAAAGSEGAEELVEHGLPLVIGAKVMQRRGRDDDIVSPRVERDLADIAMVNPGGPAAPLRHAVPRAVQHRLAEVEKVHLQIREMFEKLQ